MFVSNRFLFALFVLLHFQVAHLLVLPQSNVAVRFEMFIGSNKANEYMTPTDSPADSITASKTNSITESSTNSITESTTNSITESPTTTIPLPIQSDKFLPYLVANYSVALKSVVRNFSGESWEECLSHADGRISFSFEDGFCTYYLYAPKDRTKLSPPPKNDGNDKFIYIFSQDETDCGFTENGIQQSYQSDSFRVSRSQGCKSMYCQSGYELFRNISLEAITYYEFGNRCISFISVFFPIGWTWNSITEDIWNNQSLSVLDVFDDEMEEMVDLFKFGRYDFNMNHVLAPFSTKQLPLPLVYDAVVDEYKWLQSGRTVTKGSRVWRIDWPSADREECVAHNAHANYGIMDYDCGQFSDKAQPILLIH